MNVRDLINELQALVAEDESIAELDVYTWSETPESLVAEASDADFEGPVPPEGWVIDVLVPESFGPDGASLGHFVVIRAVVEEPTDGE